MSKNSSTKLLMTSIPNCERSTRRWVYPPPQLKSAAADASAFKILDNPETCFEEVKAHDNITAFLREQGLTVTPHAFGLQTALLAEYGTGGRVVTFNVEYDALPGIGHACGHNLIATGSLAAFLGVVAAIKKHQIAGRVRALGTPAEEGGGGKIKLIDAGAYKDVDACLMTHPFATALIPAATHGVAYGTCVASAKFGATFTGKASHAAAAPHEGVNALDAAVLAYNGLSLLRQQIKPEERIQVVILEGGHRPNIITPKSVLDLNVRSSSLKDTLVLKERVRKCFEGAAMATGCTVEFEEFASIYPASYERTVTDFRSGPMRMLSSLPIPISALPTPKLWLGSVHRRLATLRTRHCLARGLQIWVCTYPD